MLQILAPLLSGILGEELRSAATQARRSAIFLSLIGISVLVGLVFLLMAAFLTLERHYGGPCAALIMAGSAFLLAIIVLAIMKIIAASERKRRRRRVEADKSALVATAAIAAVPAILKRPILAVALPLAGIAAMAFLADSKRSKKSRRSSD